jgi:hypothetical protein
MSVLIDSNKKTTFLFLLEQSSEGEDDQLTQVSELEIENISSTVFIL